MNPHLKINQLSFGTLQTNNRSPYLQKLIFEAQRAREKSATQRNKTIKTISESQQQKNIQSFVNGYHLPKVNHINKQSAVERVYKNLTAFKRVPKKAVMTITKIETQETNKGNKILDSLQQKYQSGFHSVTQQVPSQMKKRKLEPILVQEELNYVVRSKAGSLGRQLKTNQDVAIVDTKLQYGIKVYGVCDGHGVNGHLVSAFIRESMLKLLKTALRQTEPSLQQLKDFVVTSIAQTNASLLASAINTELSGSTLVFVVIFKGTIFCFNVGDSRAIICACKEKLLEEQNALKYIQKNVVRENIDQNWKIQALSNDQKPERADERERIMKFGGRIFAQKNDKGMAVGPLRVWMKDIGAPGLAMTRSLGDKAGILAGTTALPQITQQRLTPFDRFIVVASDGVWEYMTNQDVAYIIIPHLLTYDIATAADQVVKLATLKWNTISLSRDDITLIIAIVK